MKPTERGLRMDEQIVEGYRPGAATKVDPGARAEAESGLERPLEPPATDFEVIRAMREQGGSFVRALGEAASRADTFNLDILKASWPDYWRDYAEAVRYLRPRWAGEVGEPVPSAAPCDIAQARAQIMAYEAYGIHAYTIRMTDGRLVVGNGRGLMGRGYTWPEAHADLEARLGRMANLRTESERP